MAYVYRHIRLDKNVPFYIGVSKFDDDNFRRANSKTGRNKVWNRITAITDYYVDILFEQVDLEFAKQKEIEFIALYKRINDGGSLCNIAMGGDGFFNPPIEFIESLVNRNKNNKFHLGKTHTQESKNKISKGREGKYGGDKNPSYKGKVTAYKDGVVIGEFNGIKECGVLLKANITNISSCLNGKRKSSGGYTFKRLPL
jgi:hypothetical protein